MCTTVKLSSHYAALKSRNCLIQFLVTFSFIYLQSSIPIRPMAHPPPNVPASSLTQWTLFHCAWWVTSLLFLHLSIVLSLHALPTSLSFSIIITVKDKRHTGTQRRKRLQYKRPFSASRVFLEPSRAKSGIQAASPAGSLAVCQLCDIQIYWSHTRQLRDARL